ncbi:MAG: helix-turn-helix domain-containing protein [Bacteroidales bacterium]|nr:helix-turn-helix domain-containing protein [Bacteroidales bacterium]
MGIERPQIVLASTLEGAGKGDLAEYLLHAYCHEGCCTFTYNHKVFTFRAGDCMIVRRSDLLEHVHPTEDFRVEVIHVTPEFIAISTPQSNYGTKGSISLFENPVMHLTPDQQKVCALDFDYIRRRLNLPKHNFHREAMRNAIECMIIDFFDFHAEMYGHEKITDPYAHVMEGFLALLERGDYRKNREVAYYADKLCVTPKYLSEVCKKVSGNSANFWINRYASLELLHLLKDRSLTLTDIADMFDFSSLSHFSRYVQNNLGQNPSAFRS